MSSNLHLFREIRFTDGKLTDAVLHGNGASAPTLAVAVTTDKSGA